MPVAGKRYNADVEGWDRNKVYPLPEAVERIKAFKKLKFDQTVNIVLHLGIDAKKADQTVRGSLALPHGVGKTKRVIAFCGGDKVAAALAAGAIKAGGEELVKEIEGGFMEFDVAVASPDQMRVVSRLGKVLGPKGLMPSPKSGTVTPDIAKAVTEYGAGKVEFRNDAGGTVHTIIGKQSFEPQKLIDNATAMIDAINKLRPMTAKGTYVKKCTISGSMTPSVQVEVAAHKEEENE